MTSVGQGVQSFKTTWSLHNRLCHHAKSCDVILAFGNTGKSININRVKWQTLFSLRFGKTFTTTKQPFILSELSSSLNNTERKEGKLHNVFETSFDWKECRTEKFIQQKLDYIHYNPCKAKLVELPEQYEHSSANYYFTGM